MPHCGVLDRKTSGNPFGPGGVVGKGRGEVNRGVSTVTTGSECSISHSTINRELWGLAYWAEW